MSTAVQPKPIEICICSVQFTPDRDPVLIQYQGKGITSGPFAQGQCHHTTQRKLSDRAGTAYWGDGDVKADLAAHLAEHGINAVIVDNAEPKAEPNKATVATPSA